MFLNTGGKDTFSLLVKQLFSVHVQCAVESEADCIGAADFFKKVDQLSFQSTSIREYSSNGSIGPK
jgi:hypothetical protein